MLQELLTRRMELASQTNEEEGESFVDAEMNAGVVRDSERYYRAMFHGDAISWNLRDEHMFGVLSRLLKLRSGSRAIVWAHNSHVADARASSMGVVRGELNLGQLCREAYGSDGTVSVIGCGTHAGTVAAADDWDQPMQIMEVRPARPDSFEGLLHATGVRAGVADTRSLRSHSVMRPMSQRFIGVIYRPRTEAQSHYMTTEPQNQYDAFVWFDRTTAVHAFETAQPSEPLAVGETYPFGM